ncbi:MAG: type I restriction endonuclease subunit R [Alistipes sp.]
MKFNSYIFELYKNSEHGKKVIASFKPEVGEDCYNLSVKYNPVTKAEPKDLFADTVDAIFCYHTSESEPATTMQEVRDSFMALADRGLRVENDDYFCPEDYDMILAAIAPISFAFYVSCEFCFPYLFQYNFFSLKKTADLFDIELPAVPKKSDYRARCAYYMDLCETLYAFRTENNLSPSELCAFLYDFAPNLWRCNTKEIAPKAAQAWFIGGVVSEYDKQMDTPFWQANSETKKGDILIHYETSPISSITQIWIAQTDGVVDPFFHYYSNAYIGDSKPVPSVSLKELKTDSYFAKHSLVRKGFQGVNGWPISSEDYNELLRMFRDKGADVAVLPKLYAPSTPTNVHIEHEKDVEEQLLEYYLHKMGWEEGRDYIRQLSVHAGRKVRVYPDYTLFYSDKSGYESAKVLIEAKLYMKSNREIETAFVQARSYANLLESSLIVLCDKQCLIVYDRQDGFDRDRYEKYYWSELQDPDVYRSFKDKLTNQKPTK